ncbi:MAG: FAD-dependent oxidoreductase [Novosphingobium sp.]
MHDKYPLVFSPIRLGPVEIPTRFFFAPHGSSLTIGTKPTDDLAAYSSERVRGGGCGLVFIPVVVHERGRTRQPIARQAENIPAFRAYADTIHQAGGKVFAELVYHWLAAGHWQPLSPQAPILSPSARQFAYKGRTVSTHAMNRDEIKAWQQALLQSAHNLREAGFDGIMLHASHATLIEQFLSPYFNERDDEYGGRLENRMRFMTEALEITREAIGERMALGIRFNADEMVQGGYHTDTAREVLGHLTERKLIDYVDIDVSLEPQQFHYGMPSGFVAPHFYRAYVQRVRSAAATIPVLSVLGRLTTVADAEKAIASGVCDVVGAARQLIAEPEFVQNARAGNELRSRTCIACNWCTAASGEGAQGCVINPASYRERLWGNRTLQSARRRSKVVIAGGGPGGMEAARVSSLKGHDVVLLEARDRLGGGLALWSDLPGRAILGKAVDWWQTELIRLGVDIRTGKKADAKYILHEDPDAVIVATGATYSAGGRSMTADVDIMGSNQSFVYRPEDILIDNIRPQGTVLLLDGEGLHASVGIAELLAQWGCQVHYVTAGFSPVSSYLTESFEAPFVLSRLKSAGVKFLPTTWARSIDDRKVLLYDVHTDADSALAVDAVVLVTGRVPNDGLASALEGKVPQLFTIGDALAARPLAAASYEGQKFARYIGEINTPTTNANTYFSRDAHDVNLMPADFRRFSTHM